MEGGGGREGGGRKGKGSEGKWREVKRERDEGLRDWRRKGREVWVERREMRRRGWKK